VLCSAREIKNAGTLILKKILVTLSFLILTIPSYSQYGGLLAGVEFSKPLFSDIAYPRPGFMIGFLYHDIIVRKEVDYQIEFTINNYLSFITNKYPYYENGEVHDYMIEERDYYYTSAELTILLEFPELFAKSFPNFYLGISAGYANEKYEQKIVYTVPELNPMITDSERSPLPIPLSINAGLSYTFKNYTFDLRYKLTEILLDEEDFMQNIYFVIRIHPRD
jgi:hypothetical protein